MDQAADLGLVVSAFALVAASITVVILGILYLRQTVPSPHHFGRSVCALGASGLLVGAFFMSKLTGETEVFREGLSLPQCLSTVVIIVALACIAIGILQLYGFLNPIIVAKTFVILISFIACVGMNVCCGCNGVIHV